METEIWDANSKFLWELYKILQEKYHDENLFFSPTSIMVALCMALAGACNNSEVEMKNVLHLNEVDPNKLHSSVGQLLSELNRITDGVIMKLANKLYFDASLTLEAQFMMRLQKEYSSEVSQVDFQAKYEPVRLEINKWVEIQTEEKVMNLLPDESLNSLTRMVLVNAIYFKGFWKKRFNADDTKEGDFFRVGNDPLTVQYMHMKDKLNFVSSKKFDCSAVEMPFKDGSASMVMVLPNEVDGLAKLSTQLDAVGFKELLNDTRCFEVDVSLPRFKLECEFNLKDTLSQLGMKDVFLENFADLTGCVKSPNLYISKVVHKAFIDVTEEGAEAAASTAPVVHARSFTRRASFNANHPFLVFVQTGPEKLVFMGAVQKP